MKIKQQPTLSYTVFHHFWLLSDLNMTPFPLYFHCIRHSIILIMDGVSWLRLIEVLATVFLLCNQTIFSFFGKLLFCRDRPRKTSNCRVAWWKDCLIKIDIEREDSKVLKYLFHDPILYKNILQGWSAGREGWLAKLLLNLSISITLNFVPLPLSQFAS